MTYHHRIRPSLRLASDACRRALSGLKRSCWKYQIPGSEEQKIISTQGELKSELICRETAISFVRGEKMDVRVVTSFPTLATTFPYSPTITPIISNFSKTTEEILEVETVGSTTPSQCDGTSIFSPGCSTDSETLSPDSSFYAYSNFSDMEELRPRKTFVRVREPIISDLSNQSFSIYHHYYDNYLPQFEEVNVYGPCQSDTLRSVFEDDSDDEDGYRRIGSKSKYWICHSYKTRN